MECTKLLDTRQGITVLERTLTLNIAASSRVCTETSYLRRFAPMSLIEISVWLESVQLLDTELILRKVVRCISGNQGRCRDGIGS